MFGIRYIYVDFCSKMFSYVNTLSTYAANVIIL